MTGFEYVVGFYALLLGLAVANVAVGFADMWRDRERVGVGYCAPLLAGTVLLGAMNVWLSTWATRTEVTVDGWQMLAALGISLPYVFVSRAMSPPEGATISLEDHYLRSRIPILVALAIAPAVSVYSKLRLDHFHYAEFEEVWLAFRIALPVLLMFTPSKWAQRTGLAALNALLIIGLFNWR
ncbi:MAG: hypothetical protein V4444_05265 [Pseudomonadota bacterium]